ncbi:MAG: hypothetical protein HLUCCO02_00090 [Idiomarinaceae bacterium HL-53]|nr:MAG: hypothetical protein HLUCCO02_00090 [Idiomarinaceae bacterium HL-53]
MLRSNTKRVSAMEGANDKTAGKPFCMLRSNTRRANAMDGVSASLPSNLKRTA